MGGENQDDLGCLLDRELGVDGSELPVGRGTQCDGRFHTAVRTIGVPDRHRNIAMVRGDIGRSLQQQSEPVLDWVWL